MTVEAIFSILGNFGTFFGSIVLVVWVSMRNTRWARSFWDWLSDVWYEKDWYGEYDRVLKGWDCCRWLRCIEQPMLVTRLEELEHFGHVSSKPATQTCWTMLPELTCVGVDGIGHDVHDTVHRDATGRVMLKVSLEDLMQLLVRHCGNFNRHPPWRDSPWRQKTGYGFIELVMCGRDMIGYIKIDPVPFNNPSSFEKSLKGSAVKELWEKGYTGFPDDLFRGPYTPDDCIALSTKLGHHKTGGVTMYAMTPLAISDMLYRFCLLIASGSCQACGDKWNTTAADVISMAVMFRWQPESPENVLKLATLGSKLKNAVSPFLCCDAHCIAKKNICDFFHNIVAGEFDFRGIPAWAHKRTWFGPGSVYFGGSCNSCMQTE